MCCIVLIKHRPNTTKATTKRSSPPSPRQLHYNRSPSSPLKDLERAIEAADQNLRPGCSAAFRCAPPCTARHHRAVQHQLSCLILSCIYKTSHKKLLHLKEYLTMYTYAQLCKHTPRLNLNANQTRAPLICTVWCSPPGVASNWLWLQR